MAETKFQDNYREVVFALWYEGGKNIGNKLIDAIPEENGAKPAISTIIKWRDMYGWLERAEILDVEVSQNITDEIVSKRIEMYEKHSKVAGELVEKGIQFLRDNPIDSSSDALKAIALGVDIERASIGQADVGRRILKMSDEQLTKELSRLVGKPVGNEDDIIDAETEVSDD